MSSSLIAPDTHPNRDFVFITQIGLKALNLATAHQAVIEPRVPKDTLPNLAADIKALGVVVPDAEKAWVDAKQATTEQNDALRVAATHVSAIRTVVRNAGVPKAVRSGYGVGRKMNSKLVNSVKVAVDQVLDRLQEHPEEIEALCIPQEDIGALQSVRAAVTQTDDTQEQKRASAPQSTKARNRTANRVILSVKRISAAGILAYVTSPEERALFEALHVWPKKKRVPKADKPSVPAKPTAPAPATPAPTTLASTAPAAKAPTFITSG